MKAFYFLIGMIILTGGVFLTYYEAQQTSDLSWWGEKFPVVNFILTALVMFLGIVFGCLFRRVAGSDRQINLLQELRIVFGSSSFIAALCVSPFVFMGVYVTVAASPGDAASYLLAFQNGFFCESIFNKLKLGQGQQNANGNKKSD